MTEPPLDPDEIKRFIDSHGGWGIDLIRVLMLELERARAALMSLRDRANEGCSGDELSALIHSAVREGLGE